MDLMQLRRNLLMQEWTPSNLFDKNTMFSSLTHGYLENDGTKVGSQVWYISDYIPVNGDSFVLKNIGGNAPSIVLYNANKEFLAGKNYGTPKAEIRTDVYIQSNQTAYFVRFCGYALNGYESQLMEYLDPVILQYN